MVLGRTAVNGPEDLSSARALQAQYRLTPVNAWGQDGVVLPNQRDAYAPAAASEDPLGPWKTLNAMLAETRPPPITALCSISSPGSALALVWTSRPNQTL